MARIGLMLYTLREDCARDFEGTLRAVAALGYEGVELYDLHAQAPADVGAWLEELGLVAVGRHAQLDAIEQELPELVAESHALGWRRLVVSWVDPSQLGEETLRRLERAAASVGAEGLELGYHNHDAEVREGFLDRLPPDVFLELDAGWAWWAGAEPVDLLGRGPLLHVKDFRARGERSFCPVGDGAVGYERVVPAAVRAGVEWLLVEQDETDGPALDAVARSLAAVRTMVGAAA